MCMWPGLGEGTLNKQPMVAVNAKAQRIPLPRQRPLAGPCDKEPAEFFSKKGFGALPPSPPARPDSAWAPLLLSLPPGPFTP